MKARAWPRGEGREGEYLPQILVLTAKPALKAVAVTPAVTSSDRRAVTSPYP